MKMISGGIFIVPNGISTFDSKSDLLDIEHCNALGIKTVDKNGEKRSIKDGDEKNSGLVRRA